jgi:hypothetical protein
VKSKRAASQPVFTLQENRLAVKEQCSENGSMLMFDYQSFLDI